MLELQKFNDWLKKLVLVYMSARQDTLLFEVFFGLYKPAAILHFSVSTVPAEVRLTDYGGSGRGLPADAHPHISPLDLFFFLIIVFIPQVVFTLLEPSGRTFGVYKGRLHGEKLRVQLRSVCPFSCLGSPWMTAGMEALVVCGCCCCFRCLPAAVSARYVGYGSFSLMERSSKTFLSIYLFFPPLSRGFSFGWTMHLATVRCTRLISAASHFCPKCGRDLGWLELPTMSYFWVSEILHPSSCANYS